MRLDSLRRSTPFRLAVTFGLLFIFTFLVSGAIMYRMLSSGLEHELDASLHEMNAVIASTYAPNDMEDIVATLTSYMELQTTKDGLYSLVDSEGRRVAGNFTATKMPVGVHTVTPQELGLPGFSKYRIEVTKLGQNLLVVGQSFEDVNNLLRTVLVSLGWAAIIVVSAAIGGGIFLAARAQSRLDAVARTMFDVSNGRLDSRIELQGRNDDLDLVSMQINSALDRLSGLVEGMRQVSADIAHELKTPLNRLKMTLDEAGQDIACAADVSGLLADARAESDKINSTFEALLRISQIEAGARRERFQKIDLIDIVALVEEVYVGVAEDNGQTFRVVAAQSANVLGDKELLTQLIVNLVENAITHCPEGSSVELSLFSETGQAVVQIADNGPGIPSSERERVFRRLYRLDKSRSTSGSGLGLSLVKAIADLHSAEIKLSDNQPGLAVEIVFVSI
ncbi:sensor histidine kinase [Oryzifoliimicrobium ureilyticus]|uniref:sensor histidine kinase n=1 Tax=Oryzifoliimicrobium ureilyticus TaxID=3113724 RepID=UPI0030768355